MGVLHGYSLGHMTGFRYGITHLRLHSWFLGMVITRSSLPPGKEVEETHSAATSAAGVVTFRAGVAGVTFRSRVACRIDVKSILNTGTYMIFL